MDYLAVYDISEPRRLRRVARVMEGFGVRVQKSVFECRLNKRELASLQSKLSKVIDDSEDSVRLYPMPMRQKQSILGCGTAAELGPVFVI